MSNCHFTSLLPYPLTMLTGFIYFDDKIRFLSNITTKAFLDAPIKQKKTSTISFQNFYPLEVILVSQQEGKND